MPPTVKTLLANFNLIKTVVGALIACFSFWVFSTFQTKADASEQEKVTATRIELKEVAGDVEAIEEDLQGVKTVIYGFTIEQRHTNEQLKEIAGFMKTVQSRLPP